MTFIRDRYNAEVKLKVNTDGSIDTNVINEDFGDIPEWVSSLGIDTEDATHFYFGYVQVGSSSWRIKRMRKDNYQIDWSSGEEDAQINWDNRTTLTYGVLL